MIDSRSRTEFFTFSLVYLGDGHLAFYHRKQLTWNWPKMPFLKILQIHTNLGKKFCRQGKKAAVKTKKIFFSRNLIFCASNTFFFPFDTIRYVESRRPYEYQKSFGYFFHFRQKRAEGRLFQVKLLYYSILYCNRVDEKFNVVKYTVNTLL